MNSFLKKLLGWVLYIALLAGLVYGTPRVLTHYLKTNYPMASITSGSMWPALKTGDLVFIKGVTSKDEVQVGDIIVYTNPSASSGQVPSALQSNSGQTSLGQAPTFTIHRLIEKNPETVVTKGDANDVSDTPVAYSQIIGKAVTFRGQPIRIPYLGDISIWLNQKKIQKQN